MARRRRKSSAERRIIGPLSDWGGAVEAFRSEPCPRTLAAVSLATANLANNLRDFGITVDVPHLLRVMEPQT